MKEKFTEDELIVLKELAEQHIRMNEIHYGEKTNPKPNKFPKGYTGPRSFAEAMAMKWDSHTRTWSKK